MTEQKLPTTTVANHPGNQHISKAIVGPLTARDVTVIGAALVIFIASVLPITLTFGVRNLWSLSGLYFIGIGVVLPLTVGALFAARRLSPGTKTRVGSLSVDQFASVVASFATAYFFMGTVTNFGFAYLVGLLGALAMLAATVTAQWIPAFAADFAARPESPAHVVARDAVPAVQRPIAQKPAFALPVGGRPPVPARTSAEQPTPAQMAAGQAPRGGQAGATGAGFAWNNAEAAPVHTAAGQIFTPAGTVTHNPVVATPTATFAVAATGVTESAPEQTATEAEASEAPASPSAASSPSADSAPDSAAASSAPESFDVPVISAVAESTPAEATPAEVAPAAVVPEEEAAPAAAPASIGATVDPSAKPTVVADPFWFAVDRPQNVVDEHTRQFAFKLIPGSWILALEDRGTSFLVQDSRGKTGVLYDLVGIERAPQGE